MRLSTESISNSAESHTQAVWLEDLRRFGLHSADRMNEVISVSLKIFPMQNTEGTARVCKYILFAMENKFFVIIYSERTNIPKHNLSNNP